MGSKRGAEAVGCAVIGYGMGKSHCQDIQATEGLDLRALCDMNPERTAEACKDIPGIKTYSDVTQMLARADIDLAVVVTPHNTHAELTIECLKAGKHVIVEKPMCLTAEEATAMIETAKQSERMLTVYHNRRHDGDFLAMKEVIDKGLIGEVFHVETGTYGYGRPRQVWRSDKEISGGAFYDWGAHFVDWVLHLVQGKVASVTGFFHKRMWHDVTNEDQVHAVIHFESGAVADVQLSSIARVGRPRWRILGTQGAILDQGGGSFKVNTEVEGIPAEMEVKYKERDWKAYYENIAGHLLRGQPLEVTPESARRVITIIETAEKSAKAGQTVAVRYQ